MTTSETVQFSQLTPELMLDELELGLGSKQTGIRATGTIQSLNSVENRVVEFEMDDSKRWVAKFYRPGRWSRDQILEEHRFIQMLAAAEVPAVAPIGLEGGTTLRQTKDGIWFAVFPKVRGRLKDELEDGEIRQIGRLLARIHIVSENVRAQHRPELTLLSHIDEPLQFLLDSDFLSEPYRSRYEQVVRTLRARMEPLFDSARKRSKPLLLHGDCHVGNVLWSGDGTSFFVDFDDSRVGLPIQDLWMIVPGDPRKDDEARRKQEELVEAYRVFRPLDDSAWSLVEPLRACRMVYYAAWIGRRWNDPSFPNLFPDFGTPKYWHEEHDALQQCLEVIENIPRS